MLNEKHIFSDMRERDLSITGKIMIYKGIKAVIQYQ